MEKLEGHIEGANYLVEVLKNNGSDRNEPILSEGIDQSILVKIGDGILPNEELFLYRIDELVYAQDGLKREAIENILGTFKEMHGINLIYMILGNQSEVNFYFGVAKNLYSEEDEKALDLMSYAQDMLEPSIKGNFVGSVVTPLNKNEKQEVLDRLKSARATGIMQGVPVFMEMEGNKKDFQGVERFVDTMVGSEFGFVVIAQPYKWDTVLGIEEVVHAVVDSLDPLSKYSVQITEQEQHQTNLNRSSEISQNLSLNKGLEKSTNVTKSENTSKDERNDIQHQNSESKNKSWTESINKSNSYGLSFSNPYSISKGSSASQDSANTNTNTNNSNNGNQTTSATTSSTTSKSSSSNNTSTSSVDANENLNRQTNTTDTTGNTHQWGKTANETKGVTESQSLSASEGTNTSKNKQFSLQKHKSTSKGEVESTVTSHQATHSIEVERKTATHWLKYIENTLLPRLDKGKGKGLFQVCTYLFADTNRATLYRMANTAMALYSGEKGNISPLEFIEFSSRSAKEDKPYIQDLKKALENLQIPKMVKSTNHVQTLLSKRVDKDDESHMLGFWLTVDELGLLAGLPQKEVLGLPLRNEVEFGLNVPSFDEDDDSIIHLGNLVHHGEELKHKAVYLEKKNLDKHTFICGVTGSGKTTTCQNILLDADLPFLVIEPAKTEYRVLHNRCDGIQYFTLGDDGVAPFFLNPFEIFPGESIASRADMIKATMQASFDMEAAMPQILETATYDVYKLKGWNVHTSEWTNPITGKKDDPHHPDAQAFPIIDDFIQAVVRVVERQGFDDRLKADYLGSLKARLEALTMGAKGQMLNTPRSIDFKELVTQKVVIELEEIRDSVDKSIIMGFVITNLIEAVKYQHRQNRHFQHITLVEEAHRLLSRYMPGDSLNKKRGVEIFADMLAEVRKYGESLIIVDQIPDKMTPEVLKNTNTKIVHKLFAQDDKDAIGNTMALDDEQKKFLSYLLPGRAVVFSQGWKKSAQVQVIEKNSTTDYDPIDAAVIREHALSYYAEFGTNGVLPGLSLYEGEITPSIIEKYFTYLADSQFADAFKKFLQDFSTSLQGLSEAVSKEEVLMGLFREILPYKDDVIRLFSGDTKELYEAFLMGRLRVPQSLEGMKYIKEVLKSILHMLETCHTEEALREGIYGDEMGQGKRIELEYIIEIIRILRVTQI